MAYRLDRSGDRVDQLLDKIDDLQNATTTKSGTMAMASITVISQSAFTQLSNLEEVLFENNSKLNTISLNAFRDLTKLKFINIPDNVEIIGRNAFRDCSSLTDVVIHAKTVHSQAFMGCVSLTSVTIESSVKTIQSKAFSGCSSIEIVEMKAPECPDISDINPNIFVDVSEDCKLIYPEGSDYSSWLDTGIFNVGIDASNALTFNVGIDEFAPEEDEGSSNVVWYYTDDEEHIINGYTGIDDTNATRINMTIHNGESEFPSETVAFDNMVTYDDIENKNELYTIVIPKIIKKIGPRAFSGCTKLTSITFEQGSQLETIDELAFSGCTSLTAITLPNSLKYLNKTAFNGCTGLTQITVEAITVPTLFGGNVSNVSDGGTVTYPNGSDYTSWNDFPKANWNHNEAQP